MSVKYFSDDFLRKYLERVLCRSVRTWHSEKPVRSRRFANELLFSCSLGSTFDLTVIMGWPTIFGSRSDSSCLSRML